MLSNMLSKHLADRVSSRSRSRALCCPLVSSLSSDLPRTPSCSPRPSPALRRRPSRRRTPRPKVPRWHHRSCNGRDPPLEVQKLHVPSREDDIQSCLRSRCHVTSKHLQTACYYMSEDLEKHKNRLKPPTSGWLLQQTLQMDADHILVAARCRHAGCPRWPQWSQSHLPCLQS